MNPQNEIIINEVKSDFSVENELKKISKIIKWRNNRIEEKNIQFL
jgi:hypothetical protein